MNKKMPLNDGRVLLIREAIPDHAPAILDYLEDISHESDFLTFEPGRMDLTEEQEKEIIRHYLEADNRIYLIGLLGDRVMATLVFTSGDRPRIRHSGQVSMAVRKECWGMGIGSFLMDALIKWANDTQTVRKINLRVRTDNQSAIRLYKKKGFVVEGTIHKEIFLNGTFYDLYWMGLEV